MAAEAVVLPGIACYSRYMEAVCEFHTYDDPTLRADHEAAYRYRTGIAAVWVASAVETVKRQVEGPLNDERITAIRQGIICAVGRCGMKGRPEAIVDVPLDNYQPPTPRTAETPLTAEA